MRAELIFRGLTVVTFDKLSCEAKPGDNLGAMTVWLISDPEHTKMAAALAAGAAGAAAPRGGGSSPSMSGMGTNAPTTTTTTTAASPMGAVGGMSRELDMSAHVHRPYWRMLGQENGRIDTRRLWIPRNARIELTNNPAVEQGVVVDESFLDYVPCLCDLHGVRRAIDDVVRVLARSPLVTSRIEIPHGRARAGELIAWAWRGKTPSRVAYMGTDYVGYATNELIVDIGDASDNPDQHLEVTGTGENAVQQAFAGKSGYSVAARLRPAGNSQLDDEVGPNTVQLLTTNLPPKRDYPTFWGTHFVMNSTAAGFNKMSYEKSSQFQDFATQAVSYTAPDKSVPWLLDRAMGLDQPFPFLVDIDPKMDALEKIDATGPGMLTRPLPPPGHDPENIQICPHGRI
jgi:hypothetical protein